MFKTIDFWEIERRPSIIDDIFQQLIGQNVEFRMRGISIPTIDILNELRDVLINSGAFKTVTNIIFSAKDDGRIRLTLCVF